MSWRRAMTATAALLTLTLASEPARAQSVSAVAGILELFDTDGDSAALLDHGANHVAGGGGRAADMELLASDGARTFHFQAQSATLTLGGGSHAGQLLVRDSDGATTTIELEGLTGAVFLGGNGEAGELVTTDGSDEESVRFDGASGDLTSVLDGDGLIKAWARINADGSVHSCWRCDPAFTSNFGPGFYRVNFGPLGSGVHGRPRTATIDSQDASAPTPAWIRVNDSPINDSSVTVVTGDTTDNFNAAFTVIVH